MKNIPKEIYLNLGIPKRVFDITRDDIDFNQLNGVGWSNDKIDDQDLKFVLSDVVGQTEQLKAYNDFVVRKLAEGWSVGDFDEDAINEFLSL